MSSFVLNKMPDVVRSLRNHNIKLVNEKFGANVRVNNQYILYLDKSHQGDPPAALKQKIEKACPFFEVVSMQPVSYYVGKTAVVEFWAFVNRKESEESSLL